MHTCDSHIRHFRVHGRIHVCEYDMTHVHVSHDFCYVCGMSSSCVWRELLLWVAWLLHTCDVTESYVWHNSFFWRDSTVHRACPLKFTSILFIVKFEFLNCFFSFAVLFLFLFLFPFVVPEQVIAHRLSTVVNADKIAVIKGTFHPIWHGHVTSHLCTSHVTHMTVHVTSHVCTSHVTHLAA